MLVFQLLVHGVSISLGDLHFSFTLRIIFFHGLDPSDHRRRGLDWILTLPENGPDSETLSRRNTASNEFRLQTLCPRRETRGGPGESRCIWRSLATKLCLRGPQGRKDGGAYDRAVVWEGLGPPGSSRRSWTAMTWGATSTKSRWGGRSDAESTQNVLVLIAEGSSPQSSLWTT